MADITSHRLIWIKGWLFLALGIIASGLLIGMTLDVRVAVLLAISIWAFCRFYYFVFYVIEHYVEPDYKFAGLLDFLKYAFRHRSNRHSEQ